MFSPKKHVYTKTYIFSKKKHVSWFWPSVLFFLQFLNFFLFFPVSSHFPLFYPVNSSNLNPGVWHWLPWPCFEIMLVGWYTNDLMLTVLGWHVFHCTGRGFVPEALLFWSYWTSLSEFLGGKGKSIQARQNSLSPWLSCPVFSFPFLPFLQCYVAACTPWHSSKQI